MKIIDKTTIKFVLVGIINTAVGTAVMFVLYNLFCANYWFASAMNYVGRNVHFCWVRICGAEVCSF